MNKELLILVGCSGSGKSTWAHNKWKENPLNTVIIGRDKIRELLYGYTESNVNEYYSHKNFFQLENTVTRVLEGILSEAIAEKEIVIVDNTHLSEKYLSPYLIYDTTKFVVFDTPFEQCLINVNSRERKVSEEVLRKQFQNFENLKNEYLSKNKIRSKTEFIFP